MPEPGGNQISQIFSGSPTPPDTPPRSPVTWGKIFLIILGIVFCAEVVVLGILIPYLWPEPASLWEEVILDALLLSALTALALLPVFSRFEQKTALAENQLRSENKRLEDLLRALTDQKSAIDQFALVVESDSEGLITSVNERFCEVTGYEPPGLIGRPLRSLVSETPSHTFWAEFWKSLRDVKPWRGEIALRTKDGSICQGDAIAVPFPNSLGNLAKFVSIQVVNSQPAPHRIRLQQALREIVELPGNDVAETLALALDKGRENLLFEKAVLERLDGDRVIPEAHSPRTKDNPEPLPLSASHAGFVIQAGDVVAVPKMSDSVFAVEPCVRSRGDEAFLGATVLVSGRLYGTLEFFSRAARERPFDEAEIEFVRLLARFLGALLTRQTPAKTAGEAAGHSPADFLATMSHEIRPPLDAIIGMTGLLLESGLPQGLQEQLLTIRTNGTSLLSTFNDIVDFSKIEKAQLPLENQPVGLRDCLETVLDRNAAQASEKGLELMGWIEPDVPQVILSDKIRLQQILLNLVTNAVRFTDSGEVILRIRSHREPGGQNFLHFSVKDTGAGIPEEVRDRLFQVFSQEEAPNTKWSGSTGLGLAISRRLTELMGGKIWVTSVMDKGADFQFIIPLHPVKPPLQAASSPPAHNLSGTHVLIIDDNATCRWILGELAKSLGMIPQEVQDGADALAAEESGEQIDLVLLDAQIPGMDALTIAGELRARHPDLAIIILTTRADHDHPRLKHLRIDNFVTKPVRAAALQEAMTNALAGIQPPVRISPGASDPEIAGECPLRILVAEDHPTDQRIIRLMLERLGYRPEIVANGQQVLSALQEGIFDLVLMDVQMPVMDGLTLAREIHRIHKERRPWLLAMSFNTLDGDREKYLAAGLDDCLGKPVKTDALATALRRAYYRPSQPIVQPS